VRRLKKWHIKALDFKVVVAILIPHAGEGGAQPFVGPKKEIPDEWCGMGFRNAEKLSRRGTPAQRVFPPTPQLS